MFDVRCWVLGCRMLVVGCWLLDGGCWMLVVGCWLLDVGCWARARSRPPANHQTNPNYRVAHKTGQLQARRRLFEPSNEVGHLRPRLVLANANPIVCSSTTFATSHSAAAALPP